MDCQILKFEEIPQDRYVDRLVLTQSALKKTFDCLLKKNCTYIVSHMFSVQINVQSLNKALLLQTLKVKERLIKDLAQTNNQIDGLDLGFYNKQFLILLDEFKSVIHLYDDHYKVNFDYQLLEFEKYLLTQEKLRRQQDSSCQLI